ncbi:MAG: nucleoside diphosphate kinase regulator [Kiritimatiellae bacterium]|nr:nucleoside diphosphate kinase regulator [Kiritimatiellia bacterium]
MKKRKIYVTANDHKRLTELLFEADSFNDRDRKDLQSLQAELQSAEIVESTEIPRTVVTMNSKLRFVDMDDQSETEVRLVFPSEADMTEGLLSVLSPIGTALLGYHEGDDIEWAVPAGTRRIRIEKILYQPEAAGDLDL